MAPKLTKEFAQKLMEIKGEVRGVAFRTDTEYILREKGEEDLKKLEDKMARLGYPIKYKKIETMTFYPIGLRPLSLLVVRELFNFDDSTIKKMGFFATKSSFIIRIFVLPFLSLKKVFFEEAPKIWKKHFTIGQIVPVELNEEKRYGILRVKNLNLHPIYCIYLAGYFCGILEMLLRGYKISCKETKCFFRGDEYHEYLLEWR